jgi:hypothetical protein
MSLMCVGTFVLLLVASTMFCSASSPTTIELWKHNIILVLLVGRRRDHAAGAAAAAAAVALLQ